jgi:hypothetical protein
MRSPKKRNLLPFAEELSLFLQNSHANPLTPLNPSIIIGSDSGCP